MSGDQFRIMIKIIKDSIIQEYPLTGFEFLTEFVTFNTHFG
jgi:hypothetical protein